MNQFLEKWKTVLNTRGMFCAVVRCRAESHAGKFGVFQDCFLQGITQLLLSEHPEVRRSERN